MNGTTRRGRSLAVMAGLGGAVLAAGAPAWAGDAEVGTDRGVDRAVAHELISDASQRVTLGEPDAAESLLKVNLQLQFRYAATFEAMNSGDDDFESGFEAARTRVKFSGKIPNTALSFVVVGEFGRSDGDFGLVDGFGDWAASEEVSVRFGQFKLPFTREFFGTAPSKVLLIDRSIADVVFRAERSQGVQVQFKRDRFRVFGAFSDGRKAKNTSYTSSSEADAAATVRLEFRLGEAGWKQFGDMTGFRGDKTGVLIGLAGHWQEGGVTTAPMALGDDPTYFSWTADVGAEGDGWNVMGAVYGSSIDGQGTTLNDFGFTVQGGLFVSDDTELFARYSMVSPDDDRGTGSDEFSSISGGFNYYVIPRSHAVKLTAEVVYYGDTQSESSALVSQNTLIGLLSDNDGEQVSVLVQIQLLF